MTQLEIIIDEIRKLNRKVDKLKTDKQIKKKYLYTNEVTRMFRKASAATLKRYRDKAILKDFKHNEKTKKGFRYSAEEIEQHFELKQA